MKLAQAKAIIAGVFDAAAKAGTRPLAVIVLDAGGHPVAFERQDGCSLFRLDIARAKARGALGMGADTSVLAERARGNPIFFSSVSAAVGGDIVFSPGGVLVHGAGGYTIGAVGISGDTGEVDAECAKAGLVAAGFGKGAN